MIRASGARGPGFESRTSPIFADFLFMFFTFTGEKGSYTGSSGLSVVYLSGLDPTAPRFNSEIEKGFDLEDILSLKQTITDTVAFKGVDILLTSQWPFAIDKYGSEVVSIYYSIINFTCFNCCENFQYALV